jgi:hypothetical protein
MLTETVALIAVLFGSITAGIIFARPVRASRERRRRGEPIGERPVQARQTRLRALPPMLGGDIFPIFASEPKVSARRPAPAPSPVHAPRTAPHGFRRPQTAPQRPAPWSTAAARRPTTDVG